MQIEVFPMRPEVFAKRFPVVERPVRFGFMSKAVCGLMQEGGMGLAPGGRMRQEIYEDPYSIHDWDTAHGARCFIHLVNSATWRAVTGEPPPNQPLNARQYTCAGFPWFDYYDAEMKAVAGSGTLAGLKSVKEKSEEKRAAPLPENESVTVSKVVNLRSGLQANQVRESDFAS